MDDALNESERRCGQSAPHVPPEPSPKPASFGNPLPPITFPESLPVSARRDEIAQAIAQNQVVIVCGETGSGKTTQLPKIVLQLGRGKANTGKLIGHTQPRRIAASSVAKRIAQELNMPLGEVVGFKAILFGWMNFCPHAPVSSPEQAMARTKVVLGAGARLSDYPSASLMARTFPAELVHEVLNLHGCNKFAAVRLRYPGPLDRIRFVGFRPQPVRQFPEPAALLVRLDVLEPLAVYPRRTLVGLAASVGKFQHIGPIHLVVQKMEPIPGFFLRFGI